MNCPEDFFEKMNYPELLAPNSNALEIVLGDCEVLCAYNTYQFRDYSKYNANMFSESVKAEYREKVFPEDLRKAYELGKKLAEKVK